MGANDKIGICTLLPLMERASRHLEKLVAGSLRHAPQAEAPLLAWPLACGSAVAERTRAVRFAAGVLCIEVTDQGWKRELQALAPRYLAALTRYTGPMVKQIDFVIAAGSHEGKSTGL